MFGSSIQSTSANTLASTSLYDVADDVLFSLGNDKDQVILNRSTVLNANTALSGVLIGTPVGQALAANSLIISNVTANGDIAMYGNLGGNSQQFFFYDTSASLLYLTSNTSFGSHSAGFTQQAATGDGTTTIDWKLGNKFYFTFGAQNETFTFIAPTTVTSLTLVLKQDGTGSRTVTWASGILWVGGVAPTLTTAANAIDIVTFYFDGTNYYGAMTLNFKVV